MFIYLYMFIDGLVTESTFPVLASNVQQQEEHCYWTCIVLSRIKSYMHWTGDNHTPWADLSQPIRIDGWHNWDSAQLSTCSLLKQHCYAGKKVLGVTRQCVHSSCDWFDHPSNRRPSDSKMLLSGMISHFLWQNLRRGTCLACWTHLKVERFDKINLCIAGVQYFTKLIFLK